MTTRFARPGFLIAVLAIAATSLQSSGQRKPDPPGKPPPPPLPNFVPVYEALGEPEMVVTVIALGNTIEPTRESFEARLSDLFQGEDGSVVLTNPQIAQLRTDREFENMLANDADGAAKMLANRAEVDLVVLVRLNGVGQDIEASYVVYDAQRGRNLARHGWTIRAQQGRLHNRDVQFWCQETYRQIVGKLTRFADSPQPYTIHVVDMDHRHEYAFRKQLRKIDGIDGKIRPSQDRGYGRSTSSFKLRFAGGDEMDLRYHARQALAEVTGVDPSRIKGCRMAIGGITLILLPLEEPSKSDELAGDEPSAGEVDGQSPAGRFRDAYRNVGEPRVALVINKRVTEDALSPGDSKSMNSLQRLQISRIEEDMAQRFINLGILTTEVRSKIQQVAKERDFQLRLFADYELALQYVNQDVAGLVIIGQGNEVAVGREYEIRYTFKAYTPRDSRIWATAQVEKSVNREDKNVNELLNAAEKSIAREAVIQLATRLLRQWTPPRRIRFEVRNLPSDPEFIGIMDWITEKMGEKHIRSIVRGAFKAGAAADSGFATFDVVYNGEFEGFVGALHKISEIDNAPFSIRGQEVGRQLIRIKAVSN